MQERFLKIRSVLVIVLVLNWAVAMAKVVYGLMTKCTAMSADGFHSFADGASNIIGFVGIWVASQPVDEDHPYGHKKYETFTAIVIAILLFIISFNLVHDGLARFSNPIPPYVTPISFVIMLFTIAINIIVVVYERSKGKELKSDVLIADSQHTRSDILVSISVIFTLIAIGLGFPIIDTMVSMAIALIIAYGAFGILRESSAILCDRTPLVSDEIKDVVLNIDGVKDCHKIRTRGRPDDIHIDLHILINKNMHVGKAHELNHIIEEAIKDKIAGVTDVVIHVEPDTKDEKNLAD